VVSINDWRERQHSSLAIENDRVAWFIGYDWQKLAQSFIVLNVIQTINYYFLDDIFGNHVKLTDLIKRHQFFPIHGLCLIQRNERKLLWSKRFISKWTFQGIQIVRSDRNKRAFSKINNNANFILI
jgi:hypothetical protein